LTYSHFDIPFTTREQMLPALFLRPRTPTPVLDQAAQVFDLTGVAGVAVDEAGEPDS
jgi:hypothetical protein